MIKEIIVVINVVGVVDRSFSIRKHRLNRSQAVTCHDSSAQVAPMTLLKAKHIISVINSKANNS